MLELANEFVKVLKQKFEDAAENENLIFNGESAETRLIHSEINGSKYDFHLTKLHSLQHRPEVGKVETNPFSKPEPELTILETFGDCDEFRVVLNKFPVVPCHFMLVTKEFKSQDTPLSPNELMATFSILKKLKSDDKEKKWFAFYNCGPQSGASQPHKHVQFMSLPPNFVTFTENLIQTSDSFIPDQNREPLQDKNMPFAHFVAKLPAQISEMNEESLAMTFVSLLQRTLTILRDSDCGHISYNFCATTDYMMLVPRSNGKYKDMGINSCGLLGLILCKSDHLADLVIDAGFENILGEIGFPNTSGSGSDEYHY